MAIQTTTTTDEIYKLQEEIRYLKSVINHAIELPTMGELKHYLTMALEKCCCQFWRERVRMRGDFCPNCAIHGESAGMIEGEVRIVRPLKRIR